MASDGTRCLAHLYGLEAKSQDRVVAAPAWSFVLSYEFEIHKKAIDDNLSMFYSSTIPMGLTVIGSAASGRCSQGLLASSQHPGSRYVESREQPGPPPPSGGRGGRGSRSNSHGGGRQSHGGAQARNAMRVMELS